METIVYTKTYKAPPVSRKELLRYAGAREESRELSALVDECLCEAEGRLTYRVCYARVPVSHRDTGVMLGDFSVNSESLARTLRDATSAVIFAASVGVGIDMLISRYKKISEARAFIISAIGTERIESLCDTFSLEIAEAAKEVGEVALPRFSPGYGDCPLEAQRDIFSLLDCPKHIGVSLGSSLLMSPTKSVTAIIGLKKQ